MRQDTIKTRCLTPLKLALMSEIFAGYTVLTKSMLGVGVLGVANALSKCGWTVGLIVSFMSPVIMLFSLHLLSRLAFEYKRTAGLSELSFYNVAQRVSPIAAWVLEVAVVISSVGSAVSYSFVSGTMLADVIKPQYRSDNPEIMLKTVDEGYNQWHRRLIQLGFAVVLSVPCFMKEMKKTTVLNAAAIGCLAYVVVIAVVVFDSSNVPAGEKALMNQPADIWNVFKKISTFTFAYCCTHNVFAVAGNLTNFTSKRLDFISAMATITGVIFMTITAVLPYFTYGKNVKGNFLENIESTAWWATAARIAAALQVSIGFVLVIHPTRNSIIGLMYRGGKPRDQDEFMLRCIVTTISIVASVAIAMLVTELSEPLDIAGLFGSSTMCFAVPAYLFMNTFPFKHNKATWIASAALLTFSVVIYIFGSVAIFMTWGQK
jgi:amino acid permease